MPLTVRKFNAQVKDPTSGQMIPAGLLSSDSLQAIEAAETAAVTEIQQKGVQTRESIPDDYTALSDEVDGLKTQLNTIIGDGIVITPTINNFDVNGVTANYSDGKLVLYGINNGSRLYLCLDGQNIIRSGSSAFIKTLDPGSYICHIEYSGNYTPVSPPEMPFLKYTPNTAGSTDAVNIYGDSVIKIDEPVMMGLWIRKYDNFGTIDNPTYVSISIKKIESVFDYIDNQNPYNTHVLKESGEKSISGYAHQGFPDVDYFNGQGVIVSRVSASHYTPDDSSEWGGIDINVILPNGKSEFIKTLKNSDFTGLTGELRDCYIYPTIYGLLMCGWTTLNQSPSDYHDSFIALLNKSFNIINYIINPISNTSLVGKPLITPQGHIICCGYRAGNIYICRSNEPFTGDVSTLTYTKTAIQVDEQDSTGSECSLGYNQNSLYLAARDSVSRQSSCIYKTDDLEGISGWEIFRNYIRGEDGIGTVIHSPRLIPHSNTPYLLLVGAQYRGTAKRNAVLGCINLTDPNATLYTAIIDDTLNYGGYTGFVQFNDSEFDVSYYKEGSNTQDPTTAIQSALYYKRINARMLLPYMIY